LLKKKKQKQVSDFQVSLTHAPRCVTAAEATYRHARSTVVTRGTLQQSTSRYEELVDMEAVSAGSISRNSAAAEAGCTIRS
jgi:hypothetical protein